MEATTILPNSPICPDCEEAFTSERHRRECVGEEPTHEQIALYEAVSEWKSAECWSCGERFTRQVDAELHRRESGCGDSVVSLVGPRLVN